MLQQGNQKLASFLRDPLWVTSSNLHQIKAQSRPNLAMYDATSLFWDGQNYGPSNEGPVHINKITVEHIFTLMIKCCSCCYKMSKK